MMRILRLFAGVEGEKKEGCVWGGGGRYSTGMRFLFCVSHRQ